MDKTRLMEILFVGLLFSVIADFLDVAGSSFVLWSYPVMFLPVMPPMVPVNLVYLPVMYMLIYQFFPGWKPFIVASTALAAVNSFVGEPLCVWLNIYQLNNWRHVYSFPIYILVAVVVKWATVKIQSKQGNRSGGW
ncbi:MAG: CBO0543 family protein [Syntrophomonadaceae bacterium]|nr:CBO0543 family protein [Syntrophomonadaceae bacterium]